LADRYAAGGMGSVEVLRLLDRVPLFADLPRNTLRGLVAVAEQRTYPARTLVVRQGRLSGIFFIIRKGTAAVVRREAATNGAPATTRGRAEKAQGSGITLAKELGKLTP